MKPIHEAEYAVTAHSAYGSVRGPGVYAKGLNATTPYKYFLRRDGPHVTNLQFHRELARQPRCILEAQAGNHRFLDLNNLLLIAAALAVLAVAVLLVIRARRRK